MNIVIGAGMGGLTAALHLARSGRAVTVIEARERTGGLAGGLDLEGHAFDGGPYILLDRPGLTWAFAALGLDLDAELDLLLLDEPYRVRWPNGDAFRMHHDLEQTIEGLEARWPGSGPAYRSYIEHMAATYARLSVLQRTDHPSPLSLLRRGLFREIPFLLRGLASHLRATGLPGRVQEALGIWTHIAGQTLAEAPAPLAFVPAVVHTHGAWIVQGGVRRIPEVLERAARAAGVKFRLGERVERIVRDARKVLGVEVAGERIPAERVICNASGIGTYLELLDPAEPKLNRALARLPLQSPGVAAYLRVEADESVPFLQFMLPQHGKCRMLVRPGAADPTRVGNARLVSPTDHSWAQQRTEAEQHAHLDTILAETWWREGLGEPSILARRVPRDWGRRYFLHRDSMNPVMTAAFMRKGRLPHQSPVCNNLHLVGSATHPGQWVSFCAISGILTAESIRDA